MQKNNTKGATNRSRGKKVKEINWNDPKIIRAGFIPVSEQGGIKFYGFGLENNIGEIGDFGGHRENIDKDALDTAIREYEEEGLNIFGEIKREEIQDNEVLEGEDTIEILLKVKVTAQNGIYQYTGNFRHIIGDDSKAEVQNLIWLSRKQLITAIDAKEEEIDGIKIYHMYDKIRNIIHLNRDRI